MRRGGLACGPGDRNAGHVAGSSSAGSPGSLSRPNRRARMFGLPRLRERRTASHLDTWAASSAGRAPRSQRGGREFEPPAVHQSSTLAREPGDGILARRTPHRTFVRHDPARLIIADRERLAHRNPAHRIASGAAGRCLHSGSPSKRQLKLSLLTVESNTCFVDGVRGWIPRTRQPRRIFFRVELSILPVAAGARWRYNQMTKLRSPRTNVGEHARTDD
jgi:hypothetical protein